MHVIIYIGTGNVRLCRMVDKLERYLKHLSLYVERTDLHTYIHYTPADMVITVGWNDTIARIHSDQLDAGRHSISISDGYLNRRWYDNKNGFLAVTLDGIHANGLHRFGMPEHRLYGVQPSLPTLGPWQEHGNKVVVAHQHRLAFDGASRQEWFDVTLSSLASDFSQYEVVFRNHPGDPHRQAMTESGQASSKPIWEDLDGAKALVTYDSNAAVEAAVHGVIPVTARKTMAEAIAIHSIYDIEKYEYRDRRPWLRDLAYTQWRPDEIECGHDVWQHIMAGLQKDDYREVQFLGQEKEIYYAKSSIGL